MDNVYDIELKDTTNMMTSEDYKERFKAEFYQLHIRYGKLNTLLFDMANDKLDFAPACSRELLDTQHSIMSAYLNVLRERARIEGIEL